MDFNLLLARFGFWFAWLLIPILFEFIPTLHYFVALRFMKNSDLPNEQTTHDHLPYISVIIPVYNAETTLFDCLSALNDTLYPKEKLQIIVANNHSTDNSFEEFHRASLSFPELSLQWLNTDQGKAHALNTAIYSARGKYVVNIDSDGVLEKHALLNIVNKFESDPTFKALTGTILINKYLIKQTKTLGLRILRSTEYFEYMQAFLAGRQIESSKNQLFTLSGAFSAFRKETLLQTYLYDPTTVGEDTEITFQIRENLQGKVGLCSDAIFYTEPLNGLGKLYQQRQRWQRGQIETVQSFMRERSHIGHFFSNFMVRRMLIDHTFIFCRLIWIFGLGILIYLGYSAKLLLLSLALLYALYVFSSFLNLCNASFFLKAFPKERKFLWTVSWTIFLLPLYNLLCATIRLLGVINSITKPAQWHTQSFHTEWAKITKIISDDLRKHERK